MSIINTVEGWKQLQPTHTVVEPGGEKYSLFSNVGYLRVDPKGGEAMIRTYDSREAALFTPGEVTTLLAENPTLRKIKNHNARL